MSAKELYFFDMKWWTSVSTILVFFLFMQCGIFYLMNESIIHTKQKLFRKYVFPKEKTYLLLIEH